MDNKRTVKVGDDEYGIRKLSWKKLQKAERARAFEQIGNMREMGGDLLKALRGSEQALEAATKIVNEAKSPEQIAKARYDAYDRDAILTAGVETRNGQPLRPAKIDGKGNEVEPSELDELDKLTADTLHRAIIDLSDPMPEVVEAEQGKS